MLYILLTVLKVTSLQQESTELTQSFSPFISGFTEGLQVNPGNPSNCVKSFSKISSSYDYFISIVQDIKLTQVYPIIKAFNDFVNQFVSSFDICKYASFLNKYFTDTETTVLNLLINITGNWELLNEALAQLFISLIYDSDPYVVGISMGQVIRYMTGFSL